MTRIRQLLEINFVTSGVALVITASALAFFWFLVAFAVYVGYRFQNG